MPIRRPTVLKTVQFFKRVFCVFRPAITNKQQLRLEFNYRKILQNNQSTSSLSHNTLIKNFGCWVLGVGLKLHTNSKRQRFWRSLRFSRWTVFKTVGLRRGPLLKPDDRHQNQTTVARTRLPSPQPDYRCQSQTTVTRARPSLELGNRYQNQTTTF